jgi:hypothetical protein
MTVTLTYDSTLARVRIDATALGAADQATVERSTDQIRWTTVRGGGAVGVTAGVFDLPLYDYEWSSDVVNYYRVRGVSTDPISYVATGVASTGADGSRSPAAPAGILTQDLVTILASTRNSGTGTVDTPTDWTQIVASGNVALLGRIYDGVWSMPTVTFTGGAVNATTLAQSAAFRNAALAPVTTTSQLNASAQGIATPAMVVPDDDLLIVRAGWKQDDHTSTPARAGWTEIGDFSTASGDDAMQVWETQVQTTATDLPIDSFNVLGGASAISRSLIAAFEHQAFLTEQTASILPSLGTDCGESSIWLKSIARPFLNQAVTVINRSSITINRPARVGIFDIVGRSFPIAVSDIRSSRRWTMFVRTETAVTRDNLDLLLASGDVIFVHTPADCAVPSGYVAVGDAEQATHPLRPLRVTHTLPCTEVAPPGPDVIGAQSTWQSVINAYGSWADVIAAKATWADLLALVGSPSEVIVP